MNYRSTRELVDDLRRHGKLIDIEEPLSPHLEIAEIQRRVYARGGPALLFHRPIGSRFPMVSNLFGSLEQARFIFRRTIERVRRAIELKIDPQAFFRNPLRYATAPWVAWTMLPRSVRSGPVLKNSTTIDSLPALVSWPMDGGPFVTLPQVLSQDPNSPSLTDCNLGMYRIQLLGNEYQTNQEIGLHYQIHRGIGVHHQSAIQLGTPLKVNVFVGGSPAMTLAAVMPLPEGLSELTFAGALAGHRIPMVRSQDHAPIYADADFCIVGEVDPQQLKPEGPFGDHLGYYSLIHDFPVLRVRKVYHRKDAIWPFTVVGRPPQEDTTFGQLIHDLTGPVVPTLIPGLKGVHAVDAAGVHPLLLAIGSERYTPYRKPDRPQELLTQANAILGQGQLSLAKYLLILDDASVPGLNLHDIEAFFRAFLERIDFANGLHFQTRTTIDTLDYSGDSLNFGSKVVMAASGGKRRELLQELDGINPFAPSIRRLGLAFPGVLCVEWAPDEKRSFAELRDELKLALQASPIRCSLAVITVVDDVEFACKRFSNWLWLTFTRSNPAKDIDGIGHFLEDKHWGCSGPLVIDARRKKHHAPPLLEDPQVSARIDALATRGLPISRYL